MTKIIELLHQDHQDFICLLEFLTHQLELKLQDDDLDYDLAYDAMYYISHFPDRFHHPKEDLIYHVLRQRDPASAELINKLLDEHKLLAAKSLAFFEAIKNVLNDSIQSFGEFSGIAKSFIALQRDHIDKEEREIFPLIQKTLQPADWTVIEQSLNEILIESHDDREDIIHRKHLLRNIADKVV